ncbi:DUF1178 family protein [Desulfatiglans anilini]|uniref:DUF1178 family protein n=1 Tax=Desulfatiglans anilini TaxID=90728 RepID=UPI00042A7F37|nr:DUF1178 family protein [Desulfatiglans anilini]
MIAFDLKCSRDHVFEGWFDSIEAFEDQNARRLITCPYCEDSNIRRIMSPVSIKKASPAPSHDASQPVDYHALAMAVLRSIHATFDDVGTQFAGEALKIHYGVSEKRNIRGSATDEEEKMLKEEGVEFFKFPVPRFPEDKKTN